MILFEKIYDKAIDLFDDPKIKKAYLSNKIQFSKLMYPYLDTAISLFTNPAAIGIELVNRDEPIGQMEIFDGDGVAKTFKLSFVPKEHSLLHFTQNGKSVDAMYDSIENTITFADVTLNGQECTCEYYYTGAFLSDFSNVSTAKIQEYVINTIEGSLARLLIRCWAEYRRNFLLDIQNILTTTDFNSHPASSALKSKNEWIHQLDQESNRMQTKLALTIRFAKNSYWGKRSW